MPEMIAVLARTVRGGSEFASSVGTPIRPTEWRGDQHTVMPSASSRKLLHAYLDRIRDFVRQGGRSSLRVFRLSGGF
jgi:hypothetical protein